MTLFNHDHGKMNYDKYWSHKLRPDFGVYICPSLIQCHFGVVSKKIDEKYAPVMPQCKIGEGMPPRENWQIVKKVQKNLEMIPISPLDSQKCSGVDGIEFGSGMDRYRLIKIGSWHG